MNVFDFDAGDYAEAYGRDEYVHVREGISRRSSTPRCSNTPSAS